jgi:NAD(P)-dependent dehydrogenase (short-subunit alcohol dehydrogenase family)
MDRAIIVTGASRGLGAAAARAAARLGASVVLNARSEGDLESVARDIEEAGGSAAVVAGDVADPETAHRLTAQAITISGRIDAVINNAGVLGPIQPVREADPAEWTRNWDINVLGPLMLVKEALPELRTRGGRVINVSSGAAVHAVRGWGAYCLSKAALNQLTRMIAAEEPAVTALSVRPGVVDTAMQREIREEGRQGMPAEEHARFIDYYEEGDLLPAEEPGRALALLALYAPPEWSGEFLGWDDPRVQRLDRGRTERW